MSRTRGAPRIYVCAKPLGLFITGSRGVGLHLTQGAQVDFDQAIGDDDHGPMTVERALGHYVESFVPATPVPAPFQAPKDED